MRQAAIVRSCELTRLLAVTSSHAVQRTPVVSPPVGKSNLTHRKAEAALSRKAQSYPSLSGALRRSDAAACASSSRSLASAVADDVSAIRCTLRDVPGSEADSLAETLLGLGAQSASVTEYRPLGAEEQEIFDQQGVREVWERCTVTAHFSPGHDVAGTLQVTQAAMQLQELRPELTEIKDSEWLDGICASYQPTQIADGLWIVPSWCEPPQPAATNIIVEPGLAFGTGEHPTTRLCLRSIFALEGLSGQHVLDYGTGSGVLALAALKMGASLAVGTDTDPVAVRAASQNGTLNAFPGRWVTLRCDPYIEDPDPILSNPQGFELPREFDLCVANILQGPLLELQPRLSGYVKPGGLLVLSGVLETQVDELMKAYGGAFKDFEVESEDLWAVVRARRKL